MIKRKSTAYYHNFADALASLPTFSQAERLSMPGILWKKPH
ncbi:MAG: hypothetical protein RR416_04515 [Clostridia bacterium]